MKISASVATEIAESRCERSSSGVTVLWREHEVSKRANSGKTDNLSVFDTPQRCRSGLTCLLDLAIPARAWMGTQAGHGWKFSRQSERQPCAKLNFPSRRCALRDRAELWRVYEAVRRAEICMIQGIEELAAKLKLHSFRNAEVAYQRQI